MISAGSLRLPKITHPAYKHAAQCNIEELQLRGSTLVTPKSAAQRSLNCEVVAKPVRPPSHIKLGEYVDI